MTRDFEELISTVRRIIGLDAYYIYPDSRRLIPETVVWGFASACLLEFLRGLIDFKSIGEDARSKILALLKHWREKRHFEQFVGDHELRSVVEIALSNVTEKITPAQLEAATKDLEKGLLEVGLPPETAKRHAVQVAKLFISHD